MTVEEKEKVINQWMTDNYNQMKINVWKVLGYSQIAFEKWGDDMPMIPPSWKGNNEITALISNKSSLLKDEKVEQGKEDEGQLAVFSADGKFIKVLSKNWPKDAEK